MYSLLSIGRKSIFSSLEANWFCVRNVMLKGKGVFSELLAKHVALNQFPALLLTHIDNESSPSELIEEDVEKLLQNKEYAEFYSSLK